MIGRIGDTAKRHARQQIQRVTRGVQLPGVETVVVALETGQRISPERIGRAVIQCVAEDQFVEVVGEKTCV